MHRSSAASRIALQKAACISTRLRLLRNTEIRSSQNSVAELFLADDETTSDDSASGKLVYSAIIISALEKSDEGLSSLIDKIQSGFWTDYKTRFKRAASEVFTILKNAD